MPSTQDMLGLLFNHCPNTFRHSLRVGDLLYGFSNYLNMGDAEEHFLIGVLHDIGKLKIPASLLNKKKALTFQEFEEIKRHTIYGEELIKELEDIPSSFSDIILYHHENVDGSGYFNKTEIPLLSRMIRIIDSYDTMLNGLIYQSPKRQQMVLAELVSLAGKQYDQELMKEFSHFLQTKYAINMRSIVK